MTSDLSNLDVFYGDLTATRAYVYARLPWPRDAAGLTLSGEVRGPYCRHAATLPLKVKLVDCGPGKTLLAKAVLPEACFWSPDLPAIYEVQVNLLQNGAIVASANRQLGLRELGCVERNLFLDGKRWVLRGVSSGSCEQTVPRQWQEASACLVADDPSDECLAEASRDGALTVVDLSGAEALDESQLRRLAKFPAVAIVVLSSQAEVDGALLETSPNLIFAQQTDCRAAQPASPWAQILWASADDPQLLSGWAANAKLPVVAVRKLTSPTTLEQARRACDLLQRDLAPHGQFAGYVA